MRPDFWIIVENTPLVLLHHDLCAAAFDPKFASAAPPVYVPEDDAENAKQRISNPEQSRLFDPKTERHSFYGSEAEHGLLYLPYPYLVPGGRFNEMYGWDTAFAVFAWADTHPKIMREQVDNHIYQIRHYGMVLNANRTYYLSRSHPPLITPMVLSIWEAAQKRDWADFDPDGLHEDAKSWLACIYDDLEAYYSYWTTGDRLARDTGLSRYWDDSDAPAPEVTVSEKGHFEHARMHFQTALETGMDEEDRKLFYDDGSKTLTPLYHHANRTMRASGFDPTGHWGYGGLRCMFHAPLCLNALLYRMEGDMAKISEILSRPTAPWRNRQEKRKTAMKEYMHDPATGLYHDYNFTHGQQVKKPFGNLFHLLWCGLLDDDPETARKNAGYALDTLETPHGIAMSNKTTGSQWDHPYGWPPIQHIAIAGLERCGMLKEAERLARKFVDLAAHVHMERGALYEKYNVIEGNAHFAVVHGYHENVTEHGTFLWTGATLHMARKFLVD